MQHMQHMQRPFGGAFLFPLTFTRQNWEEATYPLVCYAVVSLTIGLRG